MEELITKFQLLIPFEGETLTAYRHRAYEYTMGCLQGYNEIINVKSQAEQIRLQRRKIRRLWFLCFVLLIGLGTALYYCQYCIFR